MPREDKPNVDLVLMATGFICLLMICAVEREWGPLRPHSRGHCSAHYVIQGLDKKKYQLVT